MLSSNFLFYFFSTCLVISAFFVTISTHPIYSLLFLVSSFIFSACILFMLECEFLAFLFVIIYVGAIAVLFLFAIMMLEPKTANLLRNRMEYFPAGLAFGLFFVLPIYYQINRVTFLDSLKQMLEYETNNNPKYYKWWKDRVIDIAEADGLYINKFQNWWDLLFTVGELDVYSHTLYTLYILQFLIAGLILLLVLVGVVYLTSSSEKHARQQSDFKQLSRKAQIFSKK